MMKVLLVIFALLVTSISSVLFATDLSGKNIIKNHLFCNKSIIKFSVVTGELYALIIKNPKSVIYDIYIPEDQINSGFNFRRENNKYDTYKGSVDKIFGTEDGAGNKFEQVFHFAGKYHVLLGVNPEDPDGMTTVSSCYIETPFIPIQKGIARRRQL